MTEKEHKRLCERAAKLRPKPVELPSGAWRCQVMVGGVRQSVTGETPEEAHAKALALREGLVQKTKPVERLTVGEAIDRYIESKNSVLSPSTIRGYKKIRANYFQDIMGVPISGITREKVQLAVNKMAKENSPKSVRNAHGLLSATLAAYRPDFVLRTTLPQKEKYEAQIPTEEEIEKLLEVSHGTEMELPILLALWLGLRESEIRGLTWDCVSGNVLHVQQAIVDGEDGPILKGTKTYSGNRKIKLPKYIQELIAKQPRTDEYIVHLSGQAIYKRFVNMCQKAGLPHFRFHDLRHANASVMLALNIPDKYAMERMGHATNNMLKTVYQHTMQEKQEAVSEIVDSYFEAKLHTNLHTE